MWRNIAILLIAVTSPVSYAMNTVVGIMGSIENSSDIVQIELSQPITKKLTDFSVQSNNKVVIDLEDASSRVPRKNVINLGNMNTIDVVRVDDRVRIVVNVKQELPYTVKVEGSTITIIFTKVTSDSYPYPIITASKAVEDLILQVRTIVQDGSNLKSAIDPLNEILLLPPNEYTEEAQELIGIVYERTGQYDKAKTENKVFLALYPNSPRLSKVRERLIAIEIAEPERKTNIAAERKPRLGQDKKVEASIAEYLVIGGSQMGDSPMKQDQGSLISNVRVDSVIKDDQYDIRLAYRQSKLNNLMNPSLNKDMVTLAYADVQDTFLRRGIRVGRQNASHGAIGRFDGVLADAEISDKTRMYLLAGIPYTGPTNTSRSFYGLSVETIYNDNWSSDTYLNYQLADGINERAAIGTTFRYGNENLSFMTSLEYDLLYQAINSLTVQATSYYKSYDLYLLVDRRKAPMLYAEKALMLGLNSPMRMPYNSVGDAFANSGLSTNDVYRYINASTATSNAYAIGIGKQFTPTWNAGITYQLTNMSSAEDISFVPTVDNPFSAIQQPATNDTQSLNLHVLGTDVFGKGHTVNGFVMTASDGKSTLNTYTLMNGLQMSPWRFDVMVMHIDNNQEFAITNNNTISLRTHYRLESSAIEVQITFTDGSTFDKLSLTSTRSASASLVLGWKMDF